MMNRNETVRDVFSFAATVTIAVWQGWVAKDIIWGLWISSLLIGYSFLVVMILSSFVRGSVPMERKCKTTTKADEIKARRYRPIVTNIAVTIAAFMFLGPGSGIAWSVFLVCAVFSALNLIVSAEEGSGSGSPRHVLISRFATLTPSVLFMLGFFTVHFGGFHFVHGLFLNGFFPIVEWNPAGESPGGVFGGFNAIIAKSITEYWPFVLFSAVSRFGDYGKIVSSHKEPNMFLPYLNVIRMHLLIFVFAGLHTAGLESYAVYPVLVAYFFPAGSISKALFGRVRTGKSSIQRKKIRKVYFIETRR
jgi:hypothetical protein